MRRVSSLLTILAFVILVPILVKAAGRADRWTQEPTDLGEGVVFQTRVEMLHPTQFAVGMNEVEEKSEKLKRLSAHARRKRLMSDPIEVVVGPGGALYMIDGHHLARAVFETGHSKLYGRVRKNWSRLSEDEFWKLMKENRLYYEFDENGRGPLAPRDLPSLVADLRDDPYRSLAGRIRDEGGFEKSSVPFSEFAWARFYQEHLMLELGPLAGDQVTDKRVVKRALRLSVDPLASHLPGYLGESGRSERCMAVFGQ